MRKTPIIAGMLAACLALLANTATYGEVHSPPKETTQYEATTATEATETATTEATTEVTPEETTEEEKEISERDLYMLAHLINGEAGASYYSDKHRLYVGSVVLNRVESDWYPDTIEEVIFQKGQYACTWDGNYDREPSESSWEIAEQLLREGSVLPKNVVYQAEFTQGSGIYEEIEGSYFCYR